MSNVGGKAQQDTGNNLVQPQGVNAGDPDPDGPVSDVRSGGDPDQAPDRGQGLVGYPEEKTGEQLTGGPVGTEAPPQEKDGTSGQDSGLMS